MLSETLFRVSREPGLHVLQRRGERGARELTSSRLCLRAGERATYVSAGEETIVVLQQGRGTFATPTSDAHGLARRRVRRSAPPRCACRRASR